MPSRSLTWLTVIVLLLVSILGGFSIGRYISILPLLLTALLVSEGLKTSIRACGLALAILVWWLFSFLLVGRTTLFTGLLIEAVVCAIAFAVQQLVLARRKRSVRTD